MRIVGLGVVGAVCLFHVCAAQAAFTFHSYTSSANIESNPDPRSVSKPAFMAGGAESLVSGLGVKYASVSFLTPDQDINFKLQDLDIRGRCAAEGYGIPVSGCAKTGTAGMLCPYNSGDYQFTDRCCDKAYTQTEGSSCSGNAVLSSDYCLKGSGEGVKYYKCECPESAYPYAKDSDCPSGYQVDYNPGKTCEANGEKRYSTCMPKSYVDCSQEGSVNGVRGLLGNYGTGYGYRSDGTIVFAECRCPTDYTNYGCSTFLTTSDVCVKDGKTYYKSGDCYSGCADVSLSDIDYYYKQEALKCLFNEGGSVSDILYENGIKINTGDESKPLCTRVIDGTEQASSQTCAEMGYVYSEDECPDKEFVLARCPSNQEKVWCLNANGCLNYPVGGAACNSGARVDYCGSDGTRCVYTETACNKNWEGGAHSGTYGGSTALCCKDGWDYINGQCQPHNCGDVGYLYPYGDKYPLKEVAEGGEAGIKTCKSGDNVYYGYKQCKGCKVGDTNASNSCTDLWVPGADTPYRCVCKTEGFPYDNVTLYTSGGAGAYGTVKTCVDPDATYYGYSMCYRGFSKGMTSGEFTGKCVNYSIQQKLYRRSELPASVSATVGTKCTVTEEAACLLDDTLCHICTNDVYPYVQNTYIASTVYYLFQCDAKTGKCCSDDRQYFADGVCYNYCEWGNASCNLDDIVFKSGKVVGMVWQISGKTVSVIALEGDNVRRNWDNAKVYAEQQYAPKGLETDSTVGKGKWRLPTWNDLEQFSCANRGYRVDPVLTHLNSTLGSSYHWDWLTWTSAEGKSSSLVAENDLARYRCGLCCGQWLTKTSLNRVLPIISYTKP